ncbi:MAG: efflux RND transporter periplasmic adaptor subunit [Muribaculaceae bacterium]|nr:efflux RND transporter periplasmic adaptor subunit [Muribaculaceae bacterium]
MTSCGSKDEQNNEVTEVAEELPLIEVDVAGSRDVAQAKSYTANVEAYNSNNISPSAPNRIKTITVEVGDQVSKGQVVATLDNSSATQLKVNLDQIERDYNRARQLLEIGSGTQASVDQVKAQLDAARTQYNNIMENTVLRSPVSGVVTARNYDPGDMTQSLPILTVGQIRPSVKLLINITENDISGVSTGMPVEVTLDAFPDQNFSGTISRIYPQVDPATRTIQAEVIVPNQDGKIFPGMFGRVSLDHGSINRVVVPDRAVVKQTGSGNRYVYVYKDGKVSYNKVTLGQRIGTAYEVIDGVADGDTVVIAGQTRLADGVQARLKN